MDGAAMTDEMLLAFWCVPQPGGGLTGDHTWDKLRLKVVFCADWDVICRTKHFRETVDRRNEKKNTRVSRDDRLVQCRPFINILHNLYSMWAAGLSLSASIITVVIDRYKDGRLVSTSSHYPEMKPKHPGYVAVNQDVSPSQIIETA